jgi:hypothetical protein
MIGNVDEQVSTMVDAYRGKPQVLQQKYAMTKDMVTLLALQRIKSEQDAAKRQQSLNAQPNNSTVRQQREQEVAQNVGGVGQQQQQQQVARAHNNNKWLVLNRWEYPNKLHNKLCHNKLCHNKPAHLYKVWPQGALSGMKRVEQ